MKQYEVQLIGETPLICHRDNISWADKMSEWQKDPENRGKSKAGDDRAPAFRWMGSLYYNESTRNLALPHENISRCIMAGGTQVPVPGGRGGKTFKSQTQSGIQSLSLFWDLYVNGQLVSYDDIEPLQMEESFDKHIEAVKALGFDLLVKRARPPGQKSKHIRVRPIFDSWVLTGAIQVTDDQISLPVLEQILKYAGERAGLGDWRPSAPSPGPYGRFTAVLKEMK